MTDISVRLFLWVATTLYQAIACQLEDRNPLPGQRFDVGGYRLHLYRLGDKRDASNPTIVVDHSLGGVEGYLLADALSKLGQVCIYDRAGYGWSDHSPHPRTSDRIATELDTLLAKAGIDPPYLLVGNSFGSYNVRLYAHRFPHKVVGIVLTDGLHEEEMLKMPIQLKALKLFFTSGFIMSTLGSAFGIIRLLSVCGIFEILKPELRQFSKSSLGSVKRSFCRPKHWITMSREMIGLSASARQVRAAHQFGNLPIVGIKASSFFKPSPWTRLIPLQSANQLRNKMHVELQTLSANYYEMEAHRSGHFVWADQPEVIVDAVKHILDKAT
jgi:pimeloyl-ACP methyl ester carboxylesterase